MDDGQAQVALSDAMQLHNERLVHSNADVRRLRAELEAAETRKTQVREARLAFMRFMQPLATA